MSSFSSPRRHDPTSELLLGMRLQGVQYRRIHIGHPFGIGFANAPGRAQFHFVGRGPALLRIGDSLYALETGDAVFMPHGGAHALLSAPDVPLRNVDEFGTVPICDKICTIDPKPEDDTDCAMLFSACMEFDLGSMQPLVAAMPEVMLVGTLLERTPRSSPCWMRWSANRWAGRPASPASWRASPTWYQR